jgi:LytS/YehU family sensor histidine kinase
MVIQLSGILRFVLHESKNETISVNKELKLIRNYAELMQRRYGNRLVVEISNEITESKTVPPMIFFSIAENAFKHGISEHSESCFVRMKLVQRNNNLVFISSNSFHKIETELKDPFGSKEGIGLENLTRQLDLYFGTEYTLLSSIENGTYTCKLQISIDE